MKETLESLSKRLDLSKTTISRALSGKGEQYRINPDTVTKIIEEAQKCGYRPNFAAQMLRKKASYTIALVIPNIVNPFFANIAGVIIEEAKEKGYFINVMNTFENEDIEMESIENAYSHNMDGIILVPTGSNGKRLKAAYQPSVPLILIDRYFADTTLPYVSTNNYEGGYRATRLLLEAGHRNILCLAGESNSITTKERVRGYQDAMKEFGNEGNINVKGKDFSLMNGYIETQICLASDYQPTAIFSTSNTILLGAMKALKENKRHIPEQVSMVSFDDNIFLDYLEPAITRVIQPIQEIGIIAFDMIQDEIEKKVKANRQILLSPELIIRNSVKIL